jgi:acetyltransferase-like isoleucine patch superfamily enzyme
MQDPGGSRTTRLHFLDGSSSVFGVNTFIGAGTYLSVGNRAVFSMGPSSHIGHDCNINCAAGISIGEGTLIAQQVAIMDYDGHPVFRAGGSPGAESFGGSTAPIKIGRNVWIGFRATVLKGVTIGDGSILGAGAVVSSDVPPNSMAAGNPARVIRRGVTWRRF